MRIKFRIVDQDKMQNIEDLEENPDYNIQYEHKENFAKFDNYILNKMIKKQSQNNLKRDIPKPSGAAEQ